MNYYLAVDIGGTQMRAACYAQDNLTPQKVHRVPTQDNSAPVMERLYRLIDSVWPEHHAVAGIGVGLPGPLDPYAGVLLEAPNIPEWVNIPLRQIFADHYKTPTAVGNDANLAALGEWKYGAGRGHHFLVYLTVSTGIGGGVIMDDRLVLGARGLAGELGHIVVMPDGPVCSCGQRGHLEALASGPSIARWVENELKSGARSTLPGGQALTARSVAEAALLGDSLAINAMTRAGTFLGHAIADLLHIFNPTAVIIGGGVARSGELLFNPLRSAIRERVMNPKFLDDLTVTAAMLGDNVGLMGALALAQTAR